LLFGLTVGQITPLTHDSPGDQLGKHYPKLLDSGGKPLTKGRVDVDSVLLLGPVVVGVGLSIVGTVFGHWLDLFLVSKKNTGGVPGSRIGPQSAPPPVG
jgi:hypothetical protein